MNIEDLKNKSKNELIVIAKSLSIKTSGNKKDALIKKIQDKIDTDSTSSKNKKELVKLARSLGLRGNICERKEVLIERIEDFKKQKNETTQNVVEEDEEEEDEEEEEEKVIEEEDNDEYNNEEENDEEEEEDNEEKAIEKEVEEEEEDNEEKVIEENDEEEEEDNDEENDEEKEENDEEEEEDNDEEDEENDEEKEENDEEEEEDNDEEDEENDEEDEGNDEDEENDEEENDEEDEEQEDKFKRTRLEESTNTNKIMKCKKPVRNNKKRNKLLEEKLSVKLSTKEEKLRNEILTETDVIDEQYKEEIRTKHKSPERLKQKMQSNDIDKLISFSYIVKKSNLKIQSYIDNYIKNTKSSKFKKVLSKLKSSLSYFCELELSTIKRRAQQINGTKGIENFENKIKKEIEIHGKISERKLSDLADGYKQLQQHIDKTEKINKEIRLCKNKILNYINKLVFEYTKSSENLKLELVERENTIVSNETITCETIVLWNTIYISVDNLQKDSNFFLESNR